MQAFLELALVASAESELTAASRLCLALAEPSEKAENQITVEELFLHLDDWEPLLETASSPLQNNKVPRAVSLVASRAVWAALSPPGPQERSSEELSLVKLMLFVQPSKAYHNG